MSAPAQFRTIAGRWRAHSEILKNLPKRDQALAMMMFYAGFAASLEACNEVAEFEEAEACRLLQCMHEECKLVEGVASQMLSGALPS